MAADTTGELWHTWGMLEQSGEWRPPMATRRLSSLTVRGGCLEAKMSNEPALLGRKPTMRRVWAMPNSDTFDVQPIADLVKKYLRGVSIDPYARNKRWATHTNDLNPNTAAEHHMDATEFLVMLAQRGVLADVVLIDPPYSPRQVKECYDSFGHKMQQCDALLGAVRKRLKAAICTVLAPAGTVLTFGWNSVGMGHNCGFALVELLMVCHGSDHNDTICVVERRIQPELDFGNKWERCDSRPHDHARHKE